MRADGDGGSSRREVGHREVLGEDDAINELRTFGQTVDVGRLREVVACGIRPGNLHILRHIRTIGDGHLQRRVQGLRQGGKGRRHVLVAHLHIIDTSESITTLIAQGDIPLRVADDVMEGVLLAVSHHKVHTHPVVRVHNL